MTKYILHGGETRVASPNNAAFFQEVLKDTNENPVLLMCYFAKPESGWLEAYERGQKRFSEVSPEKEIEFVLARKEPEILTQQIKDADAIYIHGGREPLIAEVFKNIPDLKKMFAEKTMAGSSAGAHYLSRYYYTVDEKIVREGRGILPVKAFSHWQSDKYEIDWQKVAEELKKTGPELPIYKIKETEYVIVDENGQSV